MPQTQNKKPLPVRLFSALLPAVLLLLCPFCAAAAGDSRYGQSYAAYTYDLEGDPVATPVAFSPTRLITGYDLGDKMLSDPSDITYDGEDLIYITDSGNNRILAVDRSLSLVRVIDRYMLDGQETAFSSPSCTAVADGMLYIADTQNARIVVLRADDLSTDRVLARPEIAALGEYSYLPAKLAVDASGRIYVIAKNINKGLIQLSRDGEFESFLGAPKVSPSLSDIIVRRLFSRKMRDRMIKSVPTEYNAVSIDDDGFLFATSQSTNIDPIARLNGQGSNVLKYTYEAPKGDGYYADANGKRVDTLFIDIVPRSDGGYFALDHAAGRIFSYDRQGILLYVFGSVGTGRGLFYSASAMEYVDGRILVSDKSNGTITEFSLTEFGQAVNDAARLSAAGNSEEVRAAWENVLRLCSNYDTAEIQLAKLEIGEEEYTSAMRRLSAINEKTNYGIARGYARTQWLRGSFYLLATAAVLVIGLLVLWVRVLRRRPAVARVRESAFYREVTYGLHVIVHPFDGFWDLKREKRGSLRGALTILALFTVLWGVRARFSGYVFTTQPYRDIRVLRSILGILIPLVLWVISNWCFTTLMDGKGTLRDTFIASCYALTPYVLLSPLQLALSYILVNEETAFYTYLDAVILVWTIALLFFAMMMTHDYSFSKALATSLLTLLGICVILFLCLLMFNLFNEVFVFFYDLYKEISFRFY